MTLDLLCDLSSMTSVAKEIAFSLYCKHHNLAAVRDIKYKTINMNALP